MDYIITLARTIREKFILCENAYANTELIKLSQLLIERIELHHNKDVQLLLNRIVKAHESKNYVYIADLLEYELIPALLRT